MRNAEETRERIIEAAGRLMARDGFSKVGVNSLAGEAGVGKPLIYRYLGDLDGVIRALRERTGFEAGYSAAPDGRPGSPTVDQEGVQQANDVISRLLGYGRGLAADGLGRELLVRELALGGAGDAAGDEVEDAPGDATKGAGEDNLPKPPAARLQAAEKSAGATVTAAVTAADTVTDTVAIEAVLRAAIAFLVIYRDRHPAWAGVGLASPKEMVRLEEAVAWIARAAWPERRGGGSHV